MFTICILLLACCSERRVAPPSATERLPAPAAVPADASPTPTPSSSKKPEHPCVTALESLVPSTATDPLNPYYEALPYLLTTTRIVPVIYLAKPRKSENQETAQLRVALEKSGRVRKHIRALAKNLRGNKPLLREVFLRQGYLFEDRPNIAREVVRELMLTDLFDAPILYIYRDGRVHQLSRKEDVYLDESGERAKILLNDRVALDPLDLKNPIHIDLGEVRRLTGAQRILPRVVGEREAWLELVFPNGEKRSSLIEVRDSQTRLVCIAGEPTTLSDVLERAEFFWKQHRKIVWAAELMVAERPRFDEPKDEAEDVQEDGELRTAWSKAYWRRERTFKFREVEYKVFDRRGNPIPPQVCVDFVIDIWNRAGGTWFRPRGKRPGRTAGSVDLWSISGLSRRYIPSILAFAAEADTPLERYDIPRRDWIPLKKRRRFADTLAKHTAALREGDALIIHGLREQDMEEHFHAALVLATDPLTGMPMVLGDNQGWPRIGSLYGVMRAAPRRSVKHRLRLNFEKWEHYVKERELKDASSL